MALVDTLKNLRIIIEQPTADISPVAQLIQLETLWIWGPTTQVNISPLHKLTELKSFTLMGLAFTSLLNVTGIGAISNMTQLEILTLGQISVNDLSFLSPLKNLNEININQLPITSIEPMRSLNKLRTVSLNQTSIVDISPLLNVTDLTKLTVGRTPARSDVIAELQRRGVTVTSY